jgi:anti-sigma factor RsiW
MNCDQYQQQVSEFVDEELEPRNIRTLFAHLGSCDECWTYYRRIERLHTAMSRPSLTRRTAEPETSNESSSGGRSLRSRHRWLASRHPMSPASILLGSYVAFVVGVLLTLLFLPQREDLRQLPGDTIVPMHYQMTPGNSNTVPGGVRFSPWRER